MFFPLFILPFHYTASKPSLDCSRGDTIISYKAHKSAIYDISWIGTSNAALTCSGDKTVKLWDLEYSKCFTFEGHSQTVKTAKSAPGDDS